MSVKQERSGSRATSRQPPASQNACIQSSADHTDGQIDSMTDCLIAHKLRGRPDQHQPALSMAELTRLFGRTHEAEHDPTSTRRAEGEYSEGPALDRSDAGV